MTTNRSVYFVTALLLAALLLTLLQVAVINNPIPETGLNIAEIEEGRDIPRAQAAYAERMNCLFTNYLDEVEQARRARDAETARWNALWEHYQVEQAEKTK